MSPTEGQCLIADATGTLINKVVLDLGNRDDTSDVATVFGFVPVEVDGGFGDDILSGGAQSGYTVNGCPGDDKIEGINTNADPIDITPGSATTPFPPAGPSWAARCEADSAQIPSRSEGTRTLWLRRSPADRGRNVITGGAQIVGPVFRGFGIDTIDLPHATSIDCGFGRDSYGVYAGQTATRCERPLPPPSV